MTIVPVSENAHVSSKRSPKKLVEFPRHRGTEAFESSRDLESGFRWFHWVAFASLFLIFAAALVGCGGGYPGLGLSSITASAATIDAGQAVQLSTPGSGSAPVSWSLQCSAAACGSVTGSEGGTSVYQAPPYLASPIVVKVIASITGTGDSKTTTITVNPAPIISGATPSGTVGVPYSATLTTSGGTGAISLTLSSGSLPAGLAFNASTGVISGTPTTATTATVQFQAVDHSDIPDTITALRTIVISTAGAALTVLGGNPPAGVVGTPYSTALTASGGTGPYTWSILSGALPAGTSLGATTGVISGVPTTAGTFIFTAQVTDAKGATATGAFSITITASNNGGGGTLTLTVSSLPNGTVGTPYSATIGVSGGTPPYNCTITSGTLPAGLALGANCLVSGTPTVAGTQQLTVKATDSASGSTSGPESITIVAASATLTLGNPPTGTVGMAYDGIIPVSGGTSPYTCALSGGSLPAGLALNANCHITGTPTQPGSQTISVTATDSASPANTKTSPVVVTINPARLVIAPGSLPDGTVGVAYSATIPVTGGIGPYSCTITAGTLPAGLALGANCLVSGTPTTAGTSPITVMATDSESPAQTASGATSITIDPAPAQIILSNPPSGTINVPYSGSVGVSGGTGPYSCKLASGTLPAGLTLNGNCQITGTPTSAGATTIGVTATDAGNPPNTKTGNVTITINSSGLTITPGSLPAGTVGVAYSSMIGVTGGTAPYSCTLISGTLPAGLSLGANCLVSGTPTVAGSSPITVKATDSGNPMQTGTGALTITINPATVTIVVTGPPAATVGVPYTGPIGVTGGTGPYTCALASGTLPAGLMLNANCTITGTPTAPGSSPISVTVTDSSNPPNTKTAPITITVNPPTVTLTLSNPPAATVSTPYTGTIGVSGGTAPYNCVINSGTLPAGLTLGAQCTITGKPTSTGTSIVNVTATDSANPANSTTGNVTVTVQPLPPLTFTGSLPNATVGVAYTQTLAASGGLAPYTYAVTAGALPPGLTLSSAGVITGTPTAPGASSFTVTATDSETPAKTASLPLVLLVVYPTTANDGLLKGPYAFLFQGYDDVTAGVLAYQTATVGAFTADGTGVVTTGELDSNHQSSAPAGNTVPTQSLLGTYTIGTDDRGSLTITTLAADGTVASTATYAISVKAPAAPATVATQGSLIEFDNNQLAGTRGSGTFLAQTSSAFASGLTGSYAFGVSGDTPCFLACTAGLVAGPVASVGQITASSGVISTGTGDTNIASSNYASAALTGTVGTTDGDGRLAMSLVNNTVPFAEYPSDYAVYVVNANQAFVMSTDKHSAYILLAGSATLQTAAPFANASLTGAYVGYENSPTNPGLVGATLQNVLNLSTATIFRGTDSGNGVCNTTNVDQGGTTSLVNGLTGLGSGNNVLNAVLGTYASTGNSTCTVASNGRAVINYPPPSNLLSVTLGLLGIPANPPPPRVAYLTSTNTGYFLETGYAGLGRIEQQTGSPFTLGTLKGTFVYGTAPAASLASLNGSGTFAADGAGHASSTLDENVGVGTINVLQLGTTGSFTYTLTDAAAGRFLLGTSTVIYAISPTRFVLMDESALTTSPSVALLY